MQRDIASDVGRKKTVSEWKNVRHIWARRNQCQNTIRLDVYTFPSSEAQATFLPLLETLKDWMCSLQLDIHWQHGRDGITPNGSEWLTCWKSGMLVTRSRRNWDCNGRKVNTILMKSFATIRNMEMLYYVKQITPHSIAQENRASRLGQGKRSLFFNPADPQGIT